MSRGESPWIDAADIMLDDVKLVFDIGANTGQTAKQPSLSFPGAEIYCFEPVISTFESLKIEAAALERVKLFPFGFSEKKSSQTIFRQIDSGWNSLSKNEDAGLGSMEVSLETIDEFCAENNVRQVDIIKTDTEGHDLSVLRGASKMLTQGNVSAIYIEVGFYREDAGHTEFCDVLEYLKGVGFQFFGLYDQDSIVFIAHPVQPRFPWSNALFLRNDLVAQKYEAQYARWLAGLLETKSPVARTPKAIP